MSIFTELEADAFGGFQGFQGVSCSAPPTVAREQPQRNVGTAGTNMNKHTRNNVMIDAPVNVSSNIKKYIKYVQLGIPCTI